LAIHCFLLDKLCFDTHASQVDSLESKLAALGTKLGPTCIPKGPLPAQAKMRGVQRRVQRR
jgi:hypothetical protein